MPAGLDRPSARSDVCCQVLTPVTGGKTPSGDIFSALPQVPDIDRSAFHLWRRPLVLQITAFGPERLPAELWPSNYHKMVQNRLALLGKESVSVGHRRHLLSGQLGDPTHAHLHHWQ
jgi:hypothetical protein